MLKLGPFLKKIRIGLHAIIHSIFNHHDQSLYERGRDKVQEFFLSKRLGRFSILLLNKTNGLGIKLNVREEGCVFVRVVMAL